MSDESQNRTGNCLDSQDISGQVPAVGQVLGFRVNASGGVEWGPVPGGGGGGGTARFNGTLLTYQDSGPVPPPNSSIFTTWPALFAAFTAMVALTGSVTIAFDGSFNGGVCNIPAGIYDFLGRVTLIEATGQGNPVGVVTVQMLAGAQFKNVKQIEVITIQNDPATLIPALFFNTDVCDGVRTLNAPQLINQAAAPTPFMSFDTVGPGGIFVMDAINGVGFGTGPGLGPIVAIPAAGTFALAIAQNNVINSVVLGPGGAAGGGFSSGPATATLDYLADGTYGPALFKQPNTWLGTTTFSQFSQASKTIEITAVGAFTITVPLGVTEALIEACGGGGGGGGGHGGQAVVNGVSGAGGGAAKMYTRRLLGLTQLQVLAGSIGAGGAGGAGGAAGAAGVDGTFGNPTTLGTMSFAGGSGGKAGNLGANALGGAPFTNNGGNSLSDVAGNSLLGNSVSVLQGAGGRGGSDAGPGFEGAQQGGEALGGLHGAIGVGAAAIGYGGGGGGAGPYGNGGNGGVGGNTLAPGGAGVAAAANTGGGGGGGGGGGDAGQVGGAGGAGGSGRLRFTWVLSPVVPVF